MFKKSWKINDVITSFIFHQDLKTVSINIGREKPSKHNTGSKDDLLWPSESIIVKGQLKRITERDKSSQ